MSEPPASLIHDALNLVIAYRGTRGQMSTWVRLQTLASVGMERRAILREVADRLADHGFGLTARTEALVNGRFSDLVAQQERRQWIRLR